MNKNIKVLIESLFDEETDNILASDKDSIDAAFAEKINESNSMFFWKIL